MVSVTAEAFSWYGHGVSLFRTVLLYLGLPLNSAMALMSLNPVSLSTSAHRMRVVPVVQTSSTKMTGLCRMLFVGTFLTENSFFDNACRSSLFFVA